MRSSKTDQRFFAALRGLRFGFAGFVAALSQADCACRTAFAAWPIHQPVARFAAERNRLRGVPFMHA